MAKLLSGPPVPSVWYPLIHSREAPVGVMWIPPNAQNNSYQKVKLLVTWLQEALLAERKQQEWLKPAGVIDRSGAGDLPKQWKNPSCNHARRSWENRLGLQTGLVHPRVWFPSLLNMVPGCLLKIAQSLAVLKWWCEQGCGLGQRWGVAAAWLGSATGFHCSRELPRQAEHPQLCKQPLQRTAWSHHPLSPIKLRQSQIPPYKDLRIGVFLVTTGFSGCRNVVLPPTPNALFFTSHQNAFSELFRLSLRSWSVTSRCPKTRSSSKAVPSSMGFTGNPECHSGFLGSQAAEEKKCCWRQPGFDDSTILPISLCGSTHFLPFSHGHAATLLWNPGGSAMASPEL